MKDLRKKIDLNRTQLNIPKSPVTVFVFLSFSPVNEIYLSK